MGIAIRSYDDFRSRLGNLPPTRTLVAFVLADESSAQGKIHEFVELQFLQFDGFARFAQIPLFLFVGGGPNPSFEVAREFGLGLSELPGILLFAIDEAHDFAADRSWFLGFDPALIEDVKLTNEFFRDLFDRLAAIQRERSTAAQKMDLVENAVKDLRKRRRRQRLGRLMKDPVVVGLNELGGLIKLMGQAFVTGAGTVAATQITGNPGPQ